MLAQIRRRTEAGCISAPGGARGRTGEVELKLHRIAVVDVALRCPLLMQIPCFR